MTSCPNCNQPLARKQSDYGVFWACEGCGRWLIGLPILRRTIESEFFNRLWREALYSGEGTGQPCLTCSKPMNQVVVENGGNFLNLSVCRGCNVAWLTFEERASLPVQEAPKPAQPEPPPPENRLPKEAVQLLAIHQVEVMAENIRREKQFDADHLPMSQKILAAFGFPVEDSLEMAYGFPWMTTLVVVATSLASLFFFHDLKNSAEVYGFIPVEFDRMNYLTFLTCFFVHGSPMHLIGNMYFLFVFGRGVEAKIGGLDILLLLALATIGGDLFTLCFNPYGDIPNIGASGGIAGVLLFYGFAFPKRRLVFRMPTPLIGIGQIVRLPALVVLAIWVGLQVLGLFNQHGSGVAYSGHLGGLLVGLLFWLLWKWMKSGGLVKVKE